MIFRRDPFHDVIARQLDLFLEDEVELLDECRERLQSYERAPREEAEEAYGDYMDAVDAVKDALAEMRDRFAATLQGAAAERYGEAFESTAMRRWRWLG